MDLGVTSAAPECVKSIGMLSQRSTLSHQRKGGGGGGAAFNKGCALPLINQSFIRGPNIACLLKSDWTKTTEGMGGKRFCPTICIFIFIFCGDEITIQWPIEWMNFEARAICVCALRGGEGLESGAFECVNSHTRSNLYTS